MLIPLLVVSTLFALGVSILTLIARDCSAGDLFAAKKAVAQTALVVLVTGGYDLITQKRALISFVRVRTPRTAFAASENTGKWNSTKTRVVESYSGSDIYQTLPYGELSGVKQKVYEHEAPETCP